MEPSPQTGASRKKAQKPYKRHLVRSLEPTNKSLVVLMSKSFGYPKYRSMTGISGPVLDQQTIDKYTNKLSNDFN